MTGERSEPGGTAVRHSRDSERSERLASALVPSERKRAGGRGTGEKRARPPATRQPQQKGDMRTRRIEGPEPPLCMEWLSELKRERRERRLFLRSTHQTG